jgi:Tfp pilus assembly pilus retraction ATPase PilT
MSERPNRQAFAYESDPAVLGPLFVPDPLPSATWDRLLRRWDPTSGHSLLEWIVASGTLPETELLHCLREGSRARLVEAFTPLPITEWDGEARILASNGFLPLADSRGRAVVAGGAAIPPRLETFLGPRAARWEWVILSPLRSSNRSREPEGDTDSAPKPKTAAGLTNSAPPGTESWLEELIRSLALTGAPDIHFEHEEGSLRVRVRQGKGLRTAARKEGPEAAECLRILKRRAGFSTAAEPLPEDGRFCLHPFPEPLVFRAASLKTVTGESFVLRRTGSGNTVPTPAALGIPGDLVALLHDVTRNDPGLVLAAGNTGSGKTTTLCSFLAALGASAGKILSIEDPVEYDLPEATQSAVNPAAGWTFATALRAFLRQDPDILLVGEIRDAGSAETAVRAASTGHCVMSTLHARGPWLALERFREWQVEPGLLAEALRLVIHQELKHPPAVPQTRATFTWIQPRPEEVEARHIHGGSSDPPPGRQRTRKKQPSPERPTNP